LGVQDVEVTRCWWNALVCDPSKHILWVDVEPSRAKKPFFADEVKYTKHHRLGQLLSILDATSC
jgi:hypothetical protein